MMWLLKRTLSISFLLSTQNIIKTDAQKIHIFTLKILVYL